MRVTRGASRRAGVDPVKAKSPVKKAKPKAATRKSKKAKEEDVKEDDVEETHELEKTTEKPEEEEIDGSESKKRTVVIEHCKQCNSFKTRANLVKDGLEKAVSQVTVVVNPEKPRRGCFEIREEGGKTFISLLDMKRPFKPMKDLDMNQVVSDIIDELN